MDKPTVYTTPEAAKPNKKWFQTWRVIYPILGVVILVELILGIKTLLTPLPKSPAKVSQSQLPPGAIILLISDKKDFKKGDQIPVKINLFTGGKTTSGTDLVLRFNPKIVEVTNNSFTSGKIYSDYPVINIDSKLGILRVSGVASIGKMGFNGAGDFGVINFKAKAAGKTGITVDFKKGLTNDSNVIDTQTNADILERVSNLNITVQ